MADRSKGQLKIFSDSPALADAPPAVGPLAELEHLCQSLCVATGWNFRFATGPLPVNDPILQWSAPVDPGVGATPGHLRMDRDGGGTRRIGAPEAQRLAAEVLQLFSERARLRRSLREREAELAAGIPSKAHRRGSAHLAERLESVLRGGAEGLGCQAAAMYLLDDATTELKLRAQWGLPESRLLEPARPLRGALGDIEALAGHVVVLEDNMLFDLWRVPERFGAAVCAPISGPSTILGTLWLYSANARDFTARETNLIEILAGRLAADLDRELLLNQAKAERHRIARAEDAAPFAAVPSVAPLLRGWDVAATTLEPRGGLDTSEAGHCVDWQLATDGLLRAIVGQAGRGAAGSTAAGALRGAWRAGAEHDEKPAALLNSLDQFLWTASSGDVRASAIAAELNSNGEVRLSTAGDARALVVRRSEVMSLADAQARATGRHEATAAGPATASEGAALPLGREPEAGREDEIACLAAGDMLILFAALASPLVEPAAALGTATTPTTVSVLDACRALAEEVSGGTSGDARCSAKANSATAQTAAQCLRRLDEQWRTGRAGEAEEPATGVAVLVAVRRDLTGLPPRQ